MRLNEILETKTREMLECKEFVILRRLAEHLGPAIVERYIKDNVHRWEDEHVRFAVTGRSATGKSTFINAMRDVRPCDETFAKSGSGYTTRQPEAFEHPKNTKLVYYDLPGVATLHFPKEKYIKEMKLHDYDYFFIFVDKVISEDDIWLIEKLKDLNKPFCLVRSKLDDDINSAKHDGKLENEVIPEIQEKMRLDLKMHNALHPDNIIDIFVISSRNKSLGDMERLLYHIQRKLPVRKFEAMMYTFSSLSKAVIKKKYEMLKNRIVLVTAAAVISAVPIHPLGVNLNIGILVNEIDHYKRVFGFTTEEMKTLIELNPDKFNSRNVLFPEEDILNFIIGRLGIFLELDVNEATDGILVLFGYLLYKTAIVVYTFLSSFLDDIRDDAEYVLNCIASQTKAKL